MPRASARILPLATYHSRGGTPDDQWMYDIQPSAPLPTLDLTRTVNSEFFTTRMNRVYNAIKRRRVLLLLAYIITTLSYLVSLMASAAVGGHIAIFGTIIGLPGSFVMFAQLRYDVLKLLAQTFDAWFASATQIFVFTLLAMMLQDWRAIISISFWLGSWPNICHDAVLVAIRPVIVFNAICILVCAYIVFGVNCDSIDHLRQFNVLRYRDDVLPARSAVTGGFITTAAIMLRNIYRRRVVFQRRRRTRDLECVIYRCHLRLVRRGQQAHDNATPDDGKPAQSPANGPSRHIQTMRYAPILESIDVRDTLLPSAFSFVTAMPTWCGLAWPILGCLAFMLSNASGILMAVSSGTTPLQLNLVIAASILTALNSVISMALYHRQLLLVICTSFDFVFLAVQLTVLHVCACDLFQWTRSATLLAGLSWQWIHWGFLLDALTPPVKRALFIARRLPAVIYISSLCTACLLVHMMIFAKQPARTEDRVIWNGNVLGHDVMLRVIPQFYSSLALVFILLARYLGRQLALTETDFVVIDGAVVFKNSLARQRSSPVQVQPGPAVDYRAN